MPKTPTMWESFSLKSYDVGKALDCCRAWISM
jgi:hypothetical protein